MTTQTTHRLRITPRAAALRMTADETLERAYRMTWEGAEPRVREGDDEIDIDYTIGGRLRAMSPRRGTLAVALNPAVPWTIQFRGGVSGLRADLRELEVSGVTISGGASDVEFDLPEPRGELALRVGGGLSNGTVRRPARVSVGVEIEGGAVDLRLDDDHLGAVGGAIRQRTRGEAGGSGEIAVRVEGGASGLSVTALNPG